MLLSYIDPGTGSLLGSAVIGLTLALIFYMRGLFYRLLSAVTGRRNACHSDFSEQLVFFSEGRNYWHVFQPIFRELLSQNNTQQQLGGRPMVYLTADKDDPGLEWLSQYPQQVQTFCPGTLSSTIYTMNRLKAAMCVMTTPQLDIMQLKRSAHVGHYCHVMHSPDDIHTYEKFAFDYFDSVLCTSRHVMDNLRYLQQQRQTDYMRKKGLIQKRQLLETGCPYYQNYFFDSDYKPNSGTDNNADNGEKGGQATVPQLCVLLASSWGERSFLNHIESILEQLLQLSCRVIFRPHPQAWVSDKKVLEQTEKLYGERVQIDREVDNRPSMQQADVLICDISGIIYDFAFIHQKPVLALYPDQTKSAGYEAGDLQTPSSTFALLEEVGASLPIADIDQLDWLLPQVVQKQVSRRTIDKYVFHFENAGSVAARQILELYQG
ncbi:CDP-glycerol glycerophosphotransferase family protein [Candidatus Haliotispira prima]|uniref:CDP-glycerol glycerophosphotransferase family protein n=1 Tax=Candidatus Haliotispira prima TaxID=3034016 RepID=A0ABY8MJS4_9SPIO|nr:CDP-glycerol glycerophosphotransferase family protein [Candidatus Haliotispira prima]